MNTALIIFLLVICLVILTGFVLYLRISFQRGIEKNIKEINEKLETLLDNDSSEKIMVFTDKKIIKDLSAQINRILEDRQKIKADFRRSEISSKKMLSNISHDIKTPMTVILGYLEMIRLNDTAENKMLFKVEQQAEHVIELINQFFTLAKLEAGDMNLEIAKVDISEICRETILEFYEILNQKGCQIEIKIPEKAIFVSGDKNALKRILFNLLSNAVRYGLDGKYIGIFLRTDSQNVYIDVTDKGKGIEEDFAQNVFERLFTMEDSRNREIQGNGLGLTIAKNLALQMNGDILLESEPFVKTTFTVKLKNIC